MTTSVKALEEIIPFLENYSQEEKINFKSKYQIINYYNQINNTPINKENLNLIENIIKTTVSNFLKSNLKKLSLNCENDIINKFVVLNKQVEKMIETIKMLFASSLKYLKKKVDLEKLKNSIYYKFFSKEIIINSLKEDFNRKLKKLRIDEKISENNFSHFINFLLNFSNLSEENNFNIFLPLITTNIQIETEKFICEYFEKVKKEDYNDYLKKFSKFINQDFKRIFFYDKKETEFQIKKYLSSVKEELEFNLIVKIDEDILLFEEFYNSFKDYFEMQNLIFTYFYQTLNNLKSTLFSDFEELFSKIITFNLSINSRFPFLENNLLNDLKQKAFEIFYSESGENFFNFLFQKLDFYLSISNLEDSKKKTNEIIQIYAYFPKRFNFEEKYLQALKKRNKYQNRIFYEKDSFDFLKQFYSFFRIKIQLLINDLLFSKNKLKQNLCEINMINKYNWDINYLDEEFTIKVLKKCGLYESEEFFVIKNLMENNLDLKKQKYYLDPFLSSLEFEIKLPLQSQKIKLIINLIQYAVLKEIIHGTNLNSLNKEFEWIDKKYLKTLLELFFDKNIIMYKNDQLFFSQEISNNENLAEILNYEFFDKKSENNEKGTNKKSFKAILAMITKIVKEKKIIDINTLIDSVKSFTDENFQIDNIIETLIEKDIIKRDSNNFSIIYYSE